MRTIIILVFWCIPTFANGQETTAGLNTLIDYFNKSQVYFQCKEFKTTLENQTKELAKHATTPEKMDALTISYNLIWEKYDSFLKSVKGDLIGNNQSNNLISSNLDQQLTMFNEVKSTYETEFLPMYSNQVGGKAVTAELLSMGINLVKDVIIKIKEKKFDKKEAFNSTLKLVNTRFYNNLRLKTISELDISPSQVIEKSNTQTESQILVPPATLSLIQADIRFANNLNGTEVPINFSKNSGKDIEISEEPSPITNKGIVLISNENYQTGTKFKVHINSQAFIYVIVFNSTGAQLLHPQTNYQSNGKDIEIIDSVEPGIGQITLPTKGWFSIVENKNISEKNTEDFALIFSKSELLMEETIEKLNESQGTVEERIFNAFSNSIIPEGQMDLILNNDEISFNNQTSDKTVFPLIFKLLK